VGIPSVDREKRPIRAGCVERLSIRIAAFDVGKPVALITATAKWCSGKVIIVVAWWCLVPSGSPESVALLRGAMRAAFASHLSFVGIVLSSGGSPSIMAYRRDHDRSSSSLLDFTAAGSYPTAPVAEKSNAAFRGCSSVG
jgi:hypothetical protein